MVPLDLVQDDPDHNWCLGEAGKSYLIYALSGGSVTLDLSKVTGTFQAKWFDPRTGTLQVDATQAAVRGGKVKTFIAPGADDWALWLTIKPYPQGEREPGAQRK
jgi:hypothetical protein